MFNTGTEATTRAPLVRGIRRWDLVALMINAIVGAGISNWLSDYGTADIPRTKESEFFGTPWEGGSAELLWQLSPIKHAAHVTTPKTVDGTRVPTTWPAATRMKPTAR